ncbi:MAG: hypothetical protein JWO68_3955 [Actinomycetia bacterium]|nr:hypothetical protein [Actinomycetes bacterium]
MVLALSACSKATHSDGAERAAVVEGLLEVQGDAVEQSVVISSADERYAQVVWSAPQPPARQEVTLLRRRAKGWKVVYGFTNGQPVMGSCAFAPADVVEELFAARCPSERAVHARAARAGERASIEDAWRASPLTASQVDGGSLTGACISRADASWAAAVVSFPDTAGPIWLRRAPTWAVTYSSFGSSGPLPPPSAVLALASCVGYNAAMYGG